MFSAPRKSNMLKVSPTLAASFWKGVSSFLLPAFPNSFLVLSLAATAGLHSTADCISVSWYFKTQVFFLLWQRKTILIKNLVEDSVLVIFPSVEITNSRLLCSFTGSFRTAYGPSRIFFYLHQQQKRKASLTHTLFSFSLSEIHCNWTFFYFQQPDPLCSSQAQEKRAHQRAPTRKPRSSPLAQAVPAGAMPRTRWTHPSPQPTRRLRGSVSLHGLGLGTRLRFNTRTGLRKAGWRVGVKRFPTCELGNSWQRGSEAIRLL